MPQRNRKLPDEGGELRLQRCSLDGFAANRIWTIAYDDADAVPCGGAHAVGHRVDVGVDPRSHVLQVNHQHVDVFEHFCGRFAGLAVQRKHRHPAPGVARVRRFDHVVLQIGSKAMLRPEDRLQLHVAIGGQAVGGVHEGSVDGRRVGHDGDALAGNQLAIVLE